MESDKLYRWEKRRDRRRKADKGFRLDILDWVMLIMVFTMLFISIRLLFIFEALSAPCIEIILTAGQGISHPPIFQITFFISLLMGLFWLCITLHRIIFRPAHWGLIGWHIVMFISVSTLSVANWNLTSSGYVKPPDGVMVVEDVTPTITEAGVSWPAPQEIHWAKHRNDRWFAHGFQACIWLDENKVSYNDRFDLAADSRSALKLFSKGRFLETLKDNQLYRPLSEYERSVFLDIKACQADITRYGQPASACHSSYEYPVPPGIEPPGYILEDWFPDYIPKDQIQKSPLQ